MNNFENCLLYNRGASGPSYFRELIIKDVVKKSTIDCYAIEDINNIKYYLSTKNYIKYAIFHKRKIYRKSELFDIFDEYSFLVINTIYDSIKRRNGILNKHISKYFHIYLNKSIDYYLWLKSNVKVNNSKIILEDWHYLENTILFIYLNRDCSNNTVFGCFGNGYLKLSDLNNYKKNDGPYDTEFTITGEKLLSSEKYKIDIQQFYIDRFKRKGDWTSNNILMDEEDEKQQTKGKRDVKEKLIICINSISDSYFHIQERLFNSEEEWLIFTINILLENNTPFRIKLHPQAKAYGEYEYCLKILRELGVIDRLVDKMGLSHLTDLYYMPITNKGTVFQERTANKLDSIVAVPRIIDIDRSLKFRTVYDYALELKNISSTLNVTNEMSLLAKSDFFLLEYYFNIFKYFQMNDDMGVNQRNLEINLNWANTAYQKLRNNKNGYQELCDSMQQLFFGKDNFLFQTKLINEYQ
tara:strand:+ start:256 stop:1659 length:1404 start_codon:yes stop_codon:yes gene_type:complete